MKHTYTNMKVTRNNIELEVVNYVREKGTEKGTSYQSFNVEGLALKDAIEFLTEDEAIDVLRTYIRTTGLKIFKGFEENKINPSQADWQSATDNLTATSLSIPKLKEKKDSLYALLQGLMPKLKEALASGDVNAIQANMKAIDDTNDQIKAIDNSIEARKRDKSDE